MVRSPSTSRPAKVHPWCSSTAIRHPRASSRVSSRGRSANRFRLVAVDLPGHGASDNAKDPSAYSLPGHARAVRAALDALGIDQAHFIGWSLGGHVALEMAPDLRDPRGFVIFGTPPLTSGEAMREAFLPNPAMKVTFQESVDSIEASAYVAAFFRPGFADIPPFFIDDVLRTDGRARSNLGASIRPGGARDEGAVVRDLKVPLAVLHGGEEQLVNATIFRLGRDADAVARRGANDPRRRAHAAMGDASDLRRAHRSVP